MVGFVHKGIEDVFGADFLWFAREATQLALLVDSPKIDQRKFDVSYLTNGAR